MSIDGKELLNQKNMGDKSVVTKEIISENYFQIKIDITQMIESEIQILLANSSKNVESQVAKAKKMTKSTGKGS